jgi:hypothetical protein
MSSRPWHAQTIQHLLRLIAFPIDVDIVRFISISLDEFLASLAKCVLLSRVMPIEWRYVIPSEFGNHYCPIKDIKMCPARLWHIVDLLFHIAACMERTTHDYPTPVPR